MARKEPTAMAIAEAKKRIRTRVRLEMALRADELLNILLDEVEEEMQRRIATGTEAYELTTDEMWLMEAIERYYPRRNAVLDILHPDKRLELGE